MRERNLWAAARTGPGLRTWLVLGLDAFLLLLLFGWVSWWPIDDPPRGPRIDLPLVERYFLEAKEEPELRPRLTATVDGQLFVEWDPVQPGDLPARIREWIARDEAHRRQREPNGSYRLRGPRGSQLFKMGLVLAMDRRLAWSVVHSCMRTAGEQGIGDLRIEVVPRRTWRRMHRAEFIVRLQVSPDVGGAADVRRIAIKIRRDSTGKPIYRFSDREFDSVSALSDSVRPVIEQLRHKDLIAIGHIQPGGDVPFQAVVDLLYALRPYRLHRIQFAELDAPGAPVVTVKPVERDSTPH